MFGKAVSAQGCASDGDALRVREGCGIGAGVWNMMSLRWTLDALWLLLHARQKRGKSPAAKPRRGV